MTSKYIASIRLKQVQSLFSKADCRSVLSLCFISTIAKTLSLALKSRFSPMSSPIETRQLKIQARATLTWFENPEPNWQLCA